MAQNKHTRQIHSYVSDPIRPEFKCQTPKSSIQQKINVIIHSNNNKLYSSTKAKIKHS